MWSLFVLVINSLSFGLILFLIASGLTLTLGLMRVANLAHCGFAMVGGYICLFAGRTLGLGFASSISVAIIGTMLIGFVLERTLFQWIYQANQLEQALLTIGLAFVMVATTNFLFGPTLVTLPVPQSLSGNMYVGAFAVSVYRLFLVAVSSIVAAGIWIVMDYTSFGARLRAAIDSPRMAQCIGINVGLLITVTFTCACGLAALGGAIGTTLFPLEPTYAVKYLILVLVVVAVGGLGNLEGSLIAAVCIGTLDTFGRYLLPSLGGIAIYAIAAAILLLRPHGLFGSPR